jgi:hypothetical protein
MLWLAYFLAPTLTTTAVAEAFLKLVRPQWFKRRSSGHMVVVGGGPIGRIYLNAIRSLDPEVPVLLADEVDRSEELTDVETVRLSGAGEDALAPLHLEGALGLVVVTDDDLANLELAWSAQSGAPDLPIAVHVGDLALLRPVERAAKGHTVPKGFNTRQVTASYLYQIHLALHFEATEARDIVVLAGFGRFAQTILELLLKEAGAELAAVVVVDPEATLHLRRFKADVGDTSVPILGLDLDLDDPGTWEAVGTQVSSIEGTPIYLLCESDELVNLRAGLVLRRESEQPRIFLRCFHRSPFLQSLGKEQRFELLAFETVLREALREHYHEFFRSNRGERS